MVDGTYSLSIAIFDFVPVFCFLIGALFLSRLFLLIRNNIYGWLTIFGGILIFLGGALQASWKLLMSLQIANLQWMSQGQFVFMALGYFLLLITSISLIKTTRKMTQTPLTAMAAWKIPFLLVMTLASLGTYGILTYVALRRRLGIAAFGFLFALLGVILLGGMANPLQTIRMQWIEQSINSMANLGFATGSFILFRDFKGNHDMLRLYESKKQND
jgi:hypothetical protein